jgi:ATP-dependent Clp protease ATP-binding subunit ClpA
MFERFAQAARTAVEDARYEAERRGDRRIGSDHLLFALLQDDAVARLVGVDATAAHEAAERLDRTALAAIGLRLGDLQQSAYAASGRRVLRMTSGGKAVIQQSLANAAAEKARTITSRHLLLALLDRREPDPAAVLLAALPIDRPALRERLAAAA